MLKRIRASLLYRTRGLRSALERIACQFSLALRRTVCKFTLSLNRRRVFECGQKVSIIVPVYNTEKYLRQCLDSILEQTYKNIEVVCVNDCSTDNSMDILKEYAQKDRRVVIVDKPINEGLPQARKSGFLSSGGQWILMVDSDDWIEKNMVESLLGIAVPGGFDMICFDMICYSRDGKSIGTMIDIKQDKLQQIKEIIIGHGGYGGCLVCKLAKKDVYDKIEFPMENICEDQYISCQLYYYSNSTRHVPFALYHYRFNENSLMNDPQNKLLRYQNAKVIYERIYKFCREKFGDDLRIFEPELSWRLEYNESLNPQNTNNGV